jgi:hypothetical protein
MEQPGLNWGAGRPKYTQAKVALAMKMRAAGSRLREIEEKTGLSISYVSKLTRFLEVGKGRSDLGSKEASRALLLNRKKKLTKQLRQINQQLKFLAGEMVDGKSEHATVSLVGPATPTGSDSNPGSELRRVRAKAKGPTKAPDRSQTGEGLEGESTIPGGAG